MLFHDQSSACPLHNGPITDFGPPLPSITQLEDCHQTALRNRLRELDTQSNATDRNVFLTIQRSAPVALSQNDETFDKKWSALRTKRIQFNMSRDILRTRFEEEANTRSMLIDTLRRLDLEIKTSNRIFAKFHQIRSALNVTVESMRLNLSHDERQHDLLVEERVGIESRITDAENHLLIANNALEKVLTDYARLTSIYTDAFDDFSTYTSLYVFKHVAGLNYPQNFCFASSKNQNTNLDFCSHMPMI